jgi:hypothetical protein
MLGKNTHSQASQITLNRIHIYKAFTTSDTTQTCLARNFLAFLRLVAPNTGRSTTCLNSSEYPLLEVCWLRIYRSV